MRRVRSPLAPKMTTESGGRLARQAEADGERVFPHERNMVQIGREVNLSGDGTSARIANPWPGAEVTVVERTGSTMDDCLALGLRGMPSGTAVVAGFQERGRGRAPGRRWLSPAWESLLVTVLLRADELGFPPSQLPLRVGLAVSRAVEDATGAAPEIRWPNDALLGGRKVAGILCEAHGGLLLAGIGVNCRQRVVPARDRRPRGLPAPRHGPARCRRSSCARSCSPACAKRSPTTTGGPRSSGASPGAARASRVEPIGSGTARRGRRARGGRGRRAAAARRRRRHPPGRPGARSAAVDDRPAPAGGDAPQPEIRVDRHGLADLLEQGQVVDAVGVERAAARVAARPPR